MQFTPVQFADVLHHYARYYTERPGGFDDYFEDHIADGTHYQIHIDGVDAGVCCITKEHKLCCIALRDEYKKHFEQIFQRMIITDEVQGIVTITNDALMMGEILRHNYTIKKQGNNFRCYTTPPPSTLSLRLITAADEALLLELFGDFFDDHMKHIRREELFFGMEGDRIVSGAVMVRHRTSDQAASIGMIVVEDQRKKGYGTETIRALIHQAHGEGRTAQAGCWFYNHASKRTLMKAGMTPVNMIVGVDAF